MSDHPVGEGRDERPPSARARAELSAGVASDVADARLSLQEAVLRAEGHRLLGDDRGLQVALADQDRILRGLRERLGRTTSAAILQRDAEEVVAAAVFDVDLDVDLDVPDDVRVVTLDDTPVPSVPRHAPLLSGVASVVALVAVAGAIVLGTGQGPSSPGVLEVAGQIDEVERSDTPTGSPSTPGTAAGTTTDRAGSPTASSVTSTEHEATTSAGATEQAAEGEGDAAPRTLERIVQELNEVVGRFGVDPELRTDLPVEGDEDATEPDEDATDSDEDTTEPDDGDASTQPDDDGTDDGADIEDGTDGDGTDDGDDGDDEERSRLGSFVRGGDDE